MTPPSRRSLAGLVALSLSTLSPSALAAASSSSPTTCAASSNGTIIDWWNSASGDSPCRQFELLYQQCNPSFRMFNIDSSINYVCEPDQTSSDVCCCSSVSFTLFQACRSCQAGSLPTANSSTPDQTYSSYLHSCPQASITNASLASNLSSSGLSSWAFRGVSSTGTWDYSGALANATKEGVYRAEGAYKGLSSGAKAGVAIVVILLVVAGSVCFYKYALPRIRRTQARRRGDEDFEVTDAGYKSWYGPPNTPGSGDGWRGSIAGYFAGASIANNRKPSGGTNDGKWSEMKDNPTAATGSSSKDIYPASNMGFGQSSNPFMDSTTSVFQSQQHQQYEDSPFDKEDHSRFQTSFPPTEDYPTDAFDQYALGEDAEEEGEGEGRDPMDGWEEREGETDEDRQKRWEDEGRAGGGGGHSRDKSFGGGGEHGDGFSVVAM